MPEKLLKKESAIKLPEAFKPEKRPKKTVVVAGMGPGGLVSAIEALKKAYHVLFLEPRADPFTRTQRMKIMPPSYKYLKNLADPSDGEDVDFLNRIAKSEYNAIPMDALQKYLLKKMKKMMADPKYSGEMRVGPGNEVEAFDFRDKEHNFITLKYKKEGKEEGEKIEFNYFVAADGAKHRMADKLNEALEKIGARDKKIQYQDLELQTRQAPHGTVCLRARSPFTSVSMSPGVEMDENDIKELKRVGWDELFAPHCYMFHNLENNRFFIAGEIPQAILDFTQARPGETAEQAEALFEERRQEQQEMMVKWGKLIMKQQYGVRQPNKMLEWDKVNDKKKDADKVNLLRATAFEVKLQYTDTPCVALNKDAFFVSVGDATMNANFNIGHGANDAISDGEILGKCMPDEDDDRFTFGKEAFNGLRVEKREWLEREMGSKEKEDRAEYSSLSERYSGKLREALIGTGIATETKGVAEVKGTKEENYGRYLLKLSLPLEEFDGNLKKEREKFEKFLKDVTERPGNVLPDQYYQNVLAFSKAINDGIDKKIAAEPSKIKEELERLEMERKKIADDLFRINSGRLEAFRSFAILRSDSWARKRAELEHQLSDIQHKEEDLKKGLEFAGKVEYKEKMAQLKSKMPELMVKDSAVIHGFHTIKEKLRKPVRKSRDKKTEEIIAAPKPLVFESDKLAKKPDAIKEETKIMVEKKDNSEKEIKGKKSFKDKRDIPDKPVL